MNPRIAKEARQIFWPWAAVTAAAVLALVLPWNWQPAWTFTHLTEVTFVLVLFIGFPLLAGLPVGYEFQYHTLPSLLASPVERGRIWRDKVLITLAMVLAPAILCAVRARLNHVDLAFGSLVGAWIVALIAGAMFWTLFAKSTMGGLALNVAVQWLVLAGWAYLESRLRLYGYFTTAVEVAAVFLCLCYAGAMVWLGRRALLKFQDVDGASPADPLEKASAWLLPQSVSDWFRCRPQGLALNLVRKELRLLRPVWLLGVLNVIAWTFLFALGMDPGYHPLLHPTALLIVASLAATMALSPLIAILAGALSLGEEKNFGTHGWHMTLPVSVRLQWSVKLGVALLAGTLFAGALPPLALGARAWFLGAPSRVPVEHSVLLWPMVFAAVTLTSFWLSTLVKGTVRSALWVFPALFLFGAAYSLAFESGYRFALWAQAFTDRVLLWLDPFKLMSLPFPVVPIPMRDISFTTFYYFALAILAATLPVAAVVLLQSYRRFRGRAEDTNLRLAKYLLMAAAVIFVCGIGLGEFGGLIWRSWRQVGTFSHEMNAAILKVVEANPEDAGSKPVRLTAAQLEQAAPMSDFTRHWLGNGTVTVGPAPAGLLTADKMLGPHRFGFWSQRLPAKNQSLSYLASVRIRNGMTCRMYYRYKAENLPQSARFASLMFGCQ